MSERSGGRERSEQFVASEQVSGASEQAYGQASSPFFSLYSWLIWPTVQCAFEVRVGRFDMERRHRKVGLRGWKSCSYGQGE